MNLVVPSNKGLLWHLPLQPNPHLGNGCKMMGHPTPWVSGDWGGGGGGCYIEMLSKMK